MPGDEIDQTRGSAGAYTRFALEARKKFIAIRQRQDPEIRNLYFQLADRVASRLRDTANPLAPLKKSHLTRVEQALRGEADKLREGLTGILRRDIQDAVAAGSGISSRITFKLLKDGGLKVDEAVRASYFRVNNRAVEAMWRQHTKGLKLSGRIWQQGEKARGAIRDILQEAVATGQSAVDTAKLLQRYVRKDALTLAKDYPNMMDRLKGLPGDISYEALRLARAETSKAYWNGAIESARNSPGYKGMKWVLNRSHPVADICDVFASHDEGLGRGVYAPGSEPAYPHPNCICTIVAVHDQPEEFLKKLKDWQRQGPTLETLKIENWYQRVYGQPSAEIEGLPVYNMAPGYDDAADREVISRALGKLPAGHKEMLKAIDLHIGTGWTEGHSRYDMQGKTYLLARGVTVEDVIHETGHAIEDFLQVYQMKEFHRVLENNIPLEEIAWQNCIKDFGFQRPVLRLNHPQVKKFISLYQSSLQEAVGTFHEKGGVWQFNPQSLREYFAEGYREYVMNPENLKDKDIMLFNFIWELMGDAK